jgi:hypothetical protein
LSANNLLTLADARASLKQYIDGGTCDVSVIDDRINEASERLWPRLDLRASIRRVTALVRNNTVCLPQDVATVLAVTVDGTPAELMNQAYEFSAAGPGDLSCAAVSAMTPSRNLVELGDFPTQFDPPVNRVSDAAGSFANGTWDCANYLIAFSPHVDDLAHSLTIRCLGALNDEVFTDKEPGLVLKINRWAAGVEGRILNINQLPRSAVPVRQITQVYKPVTSGPVTLYAYRPDTGAMYLLSKMAPEETTPSYRRFRVTGVSAPSVKDGALTRDLAVVNMLCKIGWRRVSRASDILFVQSLSALKMMCQALHFENQGVFDRAQAYETLALRILLDQKKDTEVNPSIPLVMDFSGDVSLAGMNHTIV